MIIHKIHDLSDTHIISVLSKGLEIVTDEYELRNYHPDNNSLPENLFFLLQNGRYLEGKGAYYVIEDGGEYIASAGWNEYTFDISIALLLSRMYVNSLYRAKYYIGRHVLPQLIDESINYKTVWITCNERNKAIYNWFSRNSEGLLPSLFSNWPEIYSQFEPIGIRDVYNTKQYVAQLKR